MITGLKCSVLYCPSVGLYIPISGPGLGLLLGIAIFQLLGGQRCASDAARMRVRMITVLEDEENGDADEDGIAHAYAGECGAEQCWGSWAYEACQKKTRYQIKMAAIEQGSK